MYEKCVKSKNQTLTTLEAELVPFGSGGDLLLGGVNRLATLGALGLVRGLEGHFAGSVACVCLKVRETL